MNINNNLRGRKSRPMDKAAFDPRGLLNPGKAVPTLARCAEFNAMHVHDGRVPFPDIDRF